MQENEVTQADREAADAIVAVQFDNSHAGYHADIAAIVARHRQQAEDAMRERCLAALRATVIEVPITPGCADGASLAYAAVLSSIRGIDAGGEG